MTDQQQQPPPITLDFAEGQLALQEVFSATIGAQAIQVAMLRKQLSVQAQTIQDLTKNVDYIQDLEAELADASVREVLLLEEVKVLEGAVDEASRVVTKMSGNGEALVDHSYDPEAEIAELKEAPLPPEAFVR